MPQSPPRPKTAWQAGKSPGKDFVSVPTPEKPRSYDPTRNLAYTPPKMAPLTLAATAFFALPAVSAVAVPDVEISPGVKMPMIAFGTYRHSLTTCSVVEGVDQWLQLGGRHIDTAHDYGTEPDVGEALKKSDVKREEIFITTKIPGPIGADAVQKMVLEETLPKLGVDYVDLLLIHFPCVDQQDFPNACGSKGRKERLDTWHGITQLRKNGKVRAIGVSNYLAEQVNEVIEEFKEAPAVNQVEWHLAYHNETLRAAMHSYGTTLEAWASLAGPTGQGSPSISLGDERLKKVAGEDCTAQLELRWETQRGVVPVTATCTKDHAVGDLNAFNFTLSAKDLDYLDSLKADMEMFVSPEPTPERTRWGQQENVPSFQTEKENSADPEVSPERKTRRQSLQKLANKWSSPKDSLTEKLEQPVKTQAKETISKLASPQRALNRRKTIASAAPAAFGEVERVSPIREKRNTQVPQKQVEEMRMSRDIGLTKVNEEVPEVEEGSVAGQTHFSSVKMAVFSNKGLSLKDGDPLGASAPHRKRFVQRFPGDMRIALRVPAADHTKGELLTPRTAERCPQLQGVVPQMPGGGVPGARSAKAFHPAVCLSPQQRYQQASPVRSRQRGPMMTTTSTPCVSSHMKPALMSQVLHHRVAPVYAPHTPHVPHPAVATGKQVFVARMPEAFANSSMMRHGAPNRR
eukprot:symbB.v1.2.029336.t2/scaffold3199.1/size61439/6